jgi:hypothetical protein
VGADQFAGLHGDLPEDLLEVVGDADPGEELRELAVLLKEPLADRGTAPVVGRSGPVEGAGPLATLSVVPGRPPDPFASADLLRPEEPPVDEPVELLPGPLWGTAGLAGDLGRRGRIGGTPLEVIEDLPGR